jgi:hypothetical protein
LVLAFRIKKYSADTDKLKGLYIPYWTYDSQTHSAYAGQRGDYYYVTVNYTATENGRTVQKSRQERRTRWTNVNGTLDHFFDDVLVPASHSIPRKYAERLEPWDLKNLTPFQSSFLAGFVAEKYQVNLEEGFGMARKKMDGEINRMVQAQIGGNEQRIVDIRTNHNNVHFKHILLPVYFSSFRFKGKVFQFLINARTGEVQGDRPYSVSKIVLFVLFILGLIGGFTYLFALMD